MSSLSLNNKQAIDRILDANINRLKEGLRVCEEICRFILDDRGLTGELKSARHCIDLLAARLNRGSRLISSRFTGEDVGRTVSASGEFSRGSCRDVFYANIQRVKESLRVLEEFSKLKDARAAGGFKKARYRVYEIEKRAALKLVVVRFDRQAGLRGPGYRASGRRTQGRRRGPGPVKG
ncbi:MAG: hypothetical protein WBE75_03525 [Candidatus Omnitrophota bacterium]